MWIALLGHLESLSFFFRSPSSMASCLQKIILLNYENSLISNNNNNKTPIIKVDHHHHHHQEHNAAFLAISRRSAAAAGIMICVGVPQECLARERRNRKVIPLEDYLTTSDGLKYYDLIQGKGPIAEKGSTVQVHFDCVYNKITAVSSRESKILAGNRTIAQPYVFKVGAPPGRERKRDFVDNPNGLFSAQAAPKPPPAMYTAVEGMKVGGKRRVIVPPEAGYGKKGANEIPPGATFELNLELLQVMQPEGK